MIDLPVLEQACAVFVELARKSAFLLLAAFAISRGLRGFSASWRHLLWLITFASLLVLPVLILALPRQEVRFTKLSWMTEIEREVGSFQQDLLYGPGPGPVREAASSGDRKPAEATWPGSLGSLLAAIWALGALGFGGHLLIQYVRIGLALPRWTPLAEGGWVPDLEILKNQLGIRQSIRTVYSPETDVPLIYGFRHAVLILPLDFLCWPQERRNMVLRHELLHIRAYDHLVQFATKLVCALYWFNPLVWKAGQRALIERECVCDDG